MMLGSSIAIMSLQPTGYTVQAPSTSGATRRYCGDTKVPVEPSGYTLATLDSRVTILFSCAPTGTLVPLRYLLMSPLVS